MKGNFRLIERAVGWLLLISHQLTIEYSYTMIIVITYIQVENLPNIRLSSTWWARKIFFNT